jgi:DNA-binding transcriptional regulator YhcF (GntR family)
MAQLERTPGTKLAEEAPDVGREDDVPVGVQLAWRLRALILSGRLAADERLPGVRELAAGAGVNVNTARAIYRRLEQEGLVASRHGQGTFVVPHVAASPSLEQVAAEAAETARSLGVDPRDLARTLYAGSGPEQPYPEESPPPDPEAALAPATEEDARAARRSLRAQVARLEAELAAYPEFVEAGTEPLPLHGPEPRIADLGELETLRDELVERLKRARSEAERRERRQGAVRTHLDEMVEDPAAHKWETISNEDLGEPGCKHFHVRPAWGPVGALMNWWRVKVSAGCPLAGPREAAERNGSRRWSAPP